MILARHGVLLEQHDKLMDSLGTAVGHLTALDGLVYEQERRLDRFENDITGLLKRVETQMAALTDKLTVELEKLDTRFLTRSDAKSEYIPRKEHERRTQLHMQWPMVALTLINLAVGLRAFLH